jgi:hypothetical protein
LHSYSYLDILESLPVKNMEWLDTTEEGEDALDAATRAFHTIREVPSRLTARLAKGHGHAKKVTKLADEGEGSANISRQRQIVKVIVSRLLSDWGLILLFGRM